MRDAIATAILYGVSATYRGWLNEEVGDLAAIRFSDLDEIDYTAILPLIKIGADGVAEVGRLAIACDMEAIDVQAHLDALCQFGFVIQAPEGYRLSQRGDEVFVSIARKMINRERLEIKRRKEELDSLYEKMGRSF